MSMDDPNLRRRGFTLIELLVVIAIIALLVSILVPSLSEAQWMTKMTMCQSNLHHVGLAVGAYMTSYGMDHPFIFHGGTGDGSKESSLGRGPSAGPGNPAEAMLKEGYENFLDNAEPFFCPCEERTFETHYDMYGQDGGFGRIWGTYGWVYPHLALEEDPFHPDDHTNSRRWVGPSSKDLLMLDYRTEYYYHDNGLFLGGDVRVIARNSDAIKYFLFGEGHDSYY